MQNVLKFAVAAFVSLLAAVSIAEDQSELVTGERIAGYTGWDTFCVDYPAECNLPPMEAVKVDLTARARLALEEVNDYVNTTVKFQIDVEHWGVDNPKYTFNVRGSPGVDKWDFAEDGYGDCEDYANLKKKMLIEKGFPRSALLLTVVEVIEFEPGTKMSSKNESHMVLMVRTDHGDLILDYVAGVSTDNTVLPWQKKTNYRFKTRQSQEDPNVWLVLQTKSMVAGVN